MGLERLFLDIMGKPSHGSRHHRQNIGNGYFGKAGIAAKESLAEFEFDQWNIAFYLSSPFLAPSFAWAIFRTQKDI